MQSPSLIKSVDDYLTAYKDIIDYGFFLIPSPCGYKINFYKIVVIFIFIVKINGKNFLNQLKISSTNLSITKRNYLVTIIL